MQMETITLSIPTEMWSFMLEFENSLNPYDDVKTGIEMVSKLASEYVAIADDILEAAKDMESSGIKPRDAIHLACAVKGKAAWFLTCDDKLVKKGSFIEDRIIVVNPVDFIRTEGK